jgi:predicted AlkP superfamily pyrophosphatase or phosphodiesterase
MINAIVARLPRLFLLFFAAGLVLPQTTWGATPASDSDRIVVMISLDGLASFYLNDPIADMPTIRALAIAGTQAAMKASAPTVTWPNHTTLVTGVAPALHGVVGNNYFDRSTGKAVALISDPVYDKDEIVKVPTVYDLAKAKGLKTAAVRWPATRNAKTLDWTFPDVASDEILHRYTTPELMTECQQLGIWADGEATESGKRDLRIVSDQMCMRVFLHILHKHRPNLALLHLINVDHVQHLDGPRSPGAYAAIKTADGQVGEIWETLKRDFPDRATLIIVSDHGFAPIEHLLLPNVILREAGLVEVEDNKVTGGAVHVVAQGGSFMVYVADAAKQAAVVERVKQVFSDIDGIWKIVEPQQLKEHGIAEPKNDPHAPDMILFAKEGYGFSEAAAGQATIIEKPDRKGNHGHDENLPHLHATFVAWGLGIKPGVRLDLIQNTAVAPTVAKLLDVPMPATDAPMLSDALSN